MSCGLLYFAVVFGAGFLLGPVRVLWLVPRVGERAAELAEMPVMLLVMVIAARWIVRRLGPGAQPRHALAAGVTGLLLLLGAELGVVVWLRGLSPAEYVAGRDPVAGSVYLAMLSLFAVLPAVVAVRTQGQARPAARRRQAPTARR